MLFNKFQFKKCRLNFSKKTPKCYYKLKVDLVQQGYLTIFISEKVLLLFPKGDFEVP